MGIRSRLGSVGAAVAAVFIALSAVGFLGGLFWVFDLASNFRVQYAVMLVPIVAVLLVAKRWMIAAATSLALVVNVMLIVPLYVSIPAAAADTATLEVLSFNVRASHRERGPVIDTIAASGADIVFLHEVSAQLRKALVVAGLPYRIVSADKPGGGDGTVALVPKDAETRLLRFGDPECGSIVVTLSLGGRSLEVVGIHPPSPVTPEKASERDDMLRAVGEWTARQGLPVVVIGDFNASTWSHGFSLVTAAGLVNSQLGYGVQASWPAGHRLIAVPIDHLVHSPELTTVDRHLGERMGSDHYPLYVTLAWASS